MPVKPVDAAALLRCDVVGPVGSPNEQTTQLDDLAAPPTKILLVFAVRRLG